MTCDWVIADNSMSEINAYCHSMSMDGLAPEDAASILEQCLTEQRELVSYEDSSDQEEPLNIDCYAEAETSLDDSAVDDSDNKASYDELLQACFNNQQ